MKILTREHKTIGIITILIALARLSGIGRDILIANFYGTSDLADVFLGASRIPLTFFDFALGAAILSTFIPMFNKRLTTDGKDNAVYFANNFINIMMIITLALCAVGIIFADELTRLILKFDEEWKLTMATGVLRLLFPVIIFTALAYTAAGMLQSFGEFNIPAIISLVSNGAIISYLCVFGASHGIYGISIAMLAGWSLQFFVQLPALLKKGYRHRLIFKPKDPDMLDVFKHSVPILISSWTQPICVMINMVFASGLSGGALSSLDYANRLYIMLSSIFVFGVTNYIFPSLSRADALCDRKAFNKTIKFALKYIIIIMLGLMLTFMLFAPQIIGLIYKRGAFDDGSVKIVSDAMRYYAIGFIPFAVVEILNKGFYAQRNTVIPLIGALCGIGVNIAVTFTVIDVMGVNGLALASGIGITVTAFVLALIHWRKSKEE